MLSYLWGQADFSSKKWLRSTGKEKQPDLKGGHVLQVAFQTNYLEVGMWQTGE